jgi:hypothetical protein
MPSDGRRLAMTYVPIGAISAAASDERRKRQEEEEMTSYTREELAAGWEFKILRSATGTFKKPEALRRVLAEEARAGWTLVEKFDNGRVRLKRPADAKRGDSGLGFDPYRTCVGMSAAAFGILLAVAILAAAGVLMMIVVALQR